MNTTPSTADGVINYDVTKAEAAVAALITARFSGPADVVVAGVQTLAVLKGIDPELKIQAMELAATQWQQILSAVYAGRSLPSFGNASWAKPSMQPETVTVETEAPVNPALEALAELLSDGNIDQALAELLNAFKVLDGLTSDEREKRFRAAKRVLAGNRGYEIDAEGRLVVAGELRELKEQLAKARRDAEAAERRASDAEGKVTAAERRASDATGKLGTATARAEEAERRLSYFAQVIDPIVNYRPERGDDETDDEYTNRVRAGQAALRDSAIAAARGRMSIEDYIALRDALQDVWNHIINARGTNAHRASGMLMQSTRDAAARFFGSAG